MYEVPDGDVAPGTVAQVIQAGYMLGERVLRPALVAVAKATQKTCAVGQRQSVTRRRGLSGAKGPLLFHIHVAQEFCRAGGFAFANALSGLSAISSLE